jgi:hypothetical protein
MSWHVSLQFDQNIETIPYPVVSETSELTVKADVSGKLLEISKIEIRQ